MSLVVGVAVGGAVGALSRYRVDRVIEQRAVSAFPLSTFVINVTGCFVVGFVIAALVDGGNAPDWLRAALVVGFCGGYTTFSTPRRPWTWSSRTTRSSRS
jgi:fluoride exporter